LAAGNHVLKIVNSGGSGSMAIDAIIVYDEPLSVSSAFLNNGLKIYPQPASEFIIIEGLQAEIHYDIKIYDLNGKIRRSVPVYSGNHVYSVNTEDLDPGIYLLHVKTSKNAMYKKLIIE
jgi:hypothetical protein